MIEALKHPFAVASFMAVVSISTVMLTWWLNRKTAIHEKLDKALESKVDKENCVPAMQRVGKEIDQLGNVNGEQDKSIRGLETGMAFLVGKMGGDYQAIKRNGG